MFQLNGLQVHAFVLRAIGNMFEGYYNCSLNNFDNILKETSNFT